MRLDPDAVTLAARNGQPWTGSSKEVFGAPDPQSKWAGWITSVDATSGNLRWQFETPNPIIGGVTPTAGDVVLFGDMGGNFFALNSATGETLGRWNLSGAVSGGVINYDNGAGQTVAVTTGLTSKLWPTPTGTAKVIVLAVR